MVKKYSQEYMLMLFSSAHWTVHCYAYTSGERWLNVGRASLRLGIPFTITLSDIAMLWTIQVAWLHGRGDGTPDDDE